MSPLVFTRDKARLYDHFQKDPVLFGYHIGDLDEFYFEHCRWAVTYGYLPRIEDALLVYTGGILPTVLAFGLTTQFETLLLEMLELLPDRFHCHYSGTVERILSPRYKATPLGRHIKMKLEKFTPFVPSDQSCVIRRLEKSDCDSLIELYNQNYPGHYFHERMIESGKYYGCFGHGTLRAAAGVHVYSSEYKIAVLGNIATDSNCRGLGLASNVTSILVEELVAEGLLVCLNVNKENQSAIRLYKRLGFVAVCEYEEALFELRQ